MTNESNRFERWRSIGWLWKDWDLKGDYENDDAVNEDNNDNSKAIMMMFIVYMSIINPSGDWEDPGSTKVQNPVSWPKTSQAAIG